MYIKNTAATRLARPLDRYMSEMISGKCYCGIACQTSAWNISILHGHDFEF